MTSRYLALVVSLAMEVYKVFSRNRVRLLLLGRSFTLQLQAVEFLEVFELFPLDKVRSSGLRSRSLTFQFPVESVMISIQMLIRQLSLQICLES